MILKIAVLLFIALLVVKRKKVIAFVGRTVGPRPPKPPNG